MIDVPKLNIPKPPAGLPTANTSRATRLHEFMMMQRGGPFEVDLPKPKRNVQLSHREMLAVNADKRKYQAWLSRWDRDPGVGRFLMLGEFVKQCHGMSHAQLDEMFGHSSELVFIHMYAFLRLNYTRGCSIALQFQALRIFFDASSGYCFAEHFLSSGGSILLLELLKMQGNLSVEDINEVMNTFLSLTAHGPKAQKLMTDTKLVDTFTQCIPDFPSTDIHHLTVMLFAQIAEGDEERAELFTNAFRAKFVEYASKKGEALHTASHIFRILFSPNIAAETDIKNTISDFLALTSAESLDVQHEGIAIFQQLLDNAIPARRKFLFDVIIDLISVNADEIAADVLDQRMLQQTFALRLLQNILQKRGPTATALCDMIQRILPTLVRAIGNTQNFAAQKAACVVLSLLVQVYPNTKTFLTNAMPNEWAQALLSSPQQFCLQLTPTQIDTFQGIEPSHFFFDVVDEPQVVQEKDGSDEMTLTDAKRTKMASTIYVQPPIILRPSPLKFVPSSKPQTPRFFTARKQ